MFAFRENAVFYKPVLKLVRTIRFDMCAPFKMWFAHICRVAVLLHGSRTT